ncbi:hypothetical protein Scep_023427 [Stephania cephalantha]|uniref:Uncharacterized protein n=1 Tax=Stephania cephalantha TaxID=152367 RepID=A0AAP0EXK6_9MAGN
MSPERAAADSPLLLAGRRLLLAGVKSVWFVPTATCERRSTAYAHVCVADLENFTPIKYAYSIRVNEKSNIYNFDMVILELVIGKRLIDPEYEEKDLVKWLSTTLNKEETDHIIDPNLGSYHKEEICKILNIGLLCTNLVPTNRPSMRNVVKMLLEAHVV